MDGSPGVRAVGSRDPGGFISREPARLRTCELPPRFDLRRSLVEVVPRGQETVERWGGLLPKEILASALPIRMNLREDLGVRRHPAGR